MSSFEMTDVEKICERNYQRVKWAEEYADRETVIPFPSASRKEKAKAYRRWKRLWAATLACAGACGVGTTFLAIGISDMNVMAMITGGVVVLVFLISGYWCEAMADAAMEEVHDHEFR